MCPSVHPGRGYFFIVYSIRGELLLQNIKPYKVEHLTFVGAAATFTTCGSISPCTLALFTVFIYCTL